MFKYLPESFGDLSVKVLHMDLDFDIFDDHTVVKSALKLKALGDLKSLNLDANNLEIKSVSVDGAGCDFDYKEDENQIIVSFRSGKPILKGREFTINTETICRPTINILEGLYYDETPEGAPCQQITQCQQWGFQRIVPCIDDMTAKCTYSTTITANEKYTNMISNGDVVKERFPAGEGRETIVYNNKVTPMATYLFFLGVGTYATFEREFEYPNGDKFMLELLVPPTSDKKIAMRALDILHDGIMWIYLFTGRDKYENYEISREIKKLVDEREEIKMSGGNLDDVRLKLKEALEGMHFGYKYTGTVYREIGMQNSDFGGMENVGNTTITTNRIMPFADMTDGSFEYMIRVKVHEFYHNLNGSEVTGRSPFEIWLNEAVTVFIEQEYHEFLFGVDYSRLDDVLGFMDPVRGTFAGDDSASAMPIEPDGFNYPNELITGVTYVKAPEFVKMIETLMGKEVFVKGLDLYHTRYAHSNASRQQWIEAMEEVSGKDFQRMAQVWLKQASYPKLHAETSCNVEQKTYTVRLRQSGFHNGMHWEFPIRIALVDENGNDIAEQMYRVMEITEEIVFEGVTEPAFVSINRDYSFFGKVFYDATPEELYLQARLDKDIANKYMAFHYLSEIEKLRLLAEIAEGNEATVDEKFVDLFFELLSNEELMASVGAQIVNIFEQVEDEKYAHEYQMLYDVVKAIRLAVAEKYKDQLLAMYNAYSAKKFEGTYTEVSSKEIKARQVKNACLALLAKLDTEDVWKVIKDQFDGASCATDKVVAFGLYVNSKAPDKMDVIEEYQNISEKSNVGWESFLAAIARNDSDDYLEIIERVEKSDKFRIEQANDQRALYSVFAGNRKKALLTAEGRDFLKGRLIKLSPINEYNTGHILKVFGNIDNINERYQVALIGVLKDVQSTLDKAKTPSVYNTLQRILDGSPKGLNRWKESK